MLSNIFTWHFSPEIGRSMPRLICNVPVLLSSKSSAIMQWSSRPRWDRQMFLSYFIIFYPKLADYPGNHGKFNAEHVWTCWVPRFQTQTDLQLFRPRLSRAHFSVSSNFPPRSERIAKFFWLVVETIQNVLGVLKMIEDDRSRSRGKKSENWVPKGSHCSVSLRMSDWIGVLHS